MAKRPVAVQADEVAEERDLVGREPRAAHRAHDRVLDRRVSVRRKVEGTLLRGLDEHVLRAPPLGLRARRLEPVGPQVATHAGEVRRQPAELDRGEGPVLDRGGDGRREIAAPALEGAAVEPRGTECPRAGGRRLDEGRGHRRAHEGLERARVGDSGRRDDEHAGGTVGPRLTDVLHPRRALHPGAKDDLEAWARPGTGGQGAGERRRIRTRDHHLRDAGACERAQEALEHRDAGHHR